MTWKRVESRLGKYKGEEEIKDRMRVSPP